ncbi:MAG: type III-B CRISPR-associated protein Cas10/Cmr2 [Bacillota bacterium]
MSQSLLLFTTGPVQSFISQARKTQDLYAGSFLISHLSRQAMQRARELGAEIIFPDPEYQAVPNRFVAVVEGDEAAELQRLGNTLESTVRQEFSLLANTVINNLGLDKPPGFDAQINGLMEVYWLFLPFARGSYTKNYRKLGTMMGGIKNTRKFVQLQQEPGRRCTLTGEHNVLFYRSARDDKKFWAPGAQRVGKNIPLKYLAEGEGLGAVAFVKRCADQYFASGFDSDFDSTARIALLEAFSKLRVKDASYSKLLDSKFNAELIFDLANHQLPESIDQRELDLAQAIYAGLKKHEIPFSPYYALLIFDGDSMGKWYSEPQLHSNRSLQEFHSELSKRITEFALKMQQNTLYPPRGRTVYAGGEDFLGFVNLEHLFTVMQELRLSFGQIDLSDYTVGNLSFSAGVVIAHFKTPLAEVLKWARKMEEQAKTIDEYKDAFGIAVLKHSGETHHTLLKWKYSEQWSTDILQQLSIALKEKDFSTAFIKNLGWEFSKLTGLADGERVPSLDKMVATEIKRLLGRAWQPRGQQTTNKQHMIAQKRKDIAVLAEQLYTLYLDSRSFDNFFNALNIVMFLNRNRGEIK